MTELYYCYLKVFGSHFDAEGFSHSIALADAIIVKKHKAYPRSPIKAIRAGNVNYWQTPKKYFIKKIKDNPFTEYLDEEEFMIDFINAFFNLRSPLQHYQNNTTEVWFVAVYKASPDAKPAGVHFGHKLIAALHKIEASISTEIVFS